MSLRKPDARDVKKRLVVEVERARHKHGGGLYVASVPDHTTFTVRLPLQA